MKKATQKPAAQKTPIDPAKELVKAQRKTKKLQQQAKMYYAWYIDEREQKEKAIKEYKESQYVAKIFKEQAEDYSARYAKMLEERIEESKKKIKEQWQEIDYKLGTVKPWAHDDKGIKKPQTDSTPPLRILCIETGPIEYKFYDGDIQIKTGEAAPLELCEVYTTPGAIVDEWGVISYPINEFGGIEMLAQRFVVLENKP